MNILHSRPSLCRYITKLVVLEGHIITYGFTHRHQSSRYESTTQPLRCKPTTNGISRFKLAVKTCIYSHGGNWQDKSLHCFCRRAGKFSLQIFSLKSRVIFHIANQFSIRATTALRISNFISRKCRCGNAHKFLWKSIHSSLECERRISFRIQSGIFRTAIFRNFIWKFPPWW